MDFDIDLPDLTCPDLFLISVERVTYGEEFAGPMPISLLYTPLGNCAGHYDTLRKSNPSEQLNRNPCSPVLGLSLPTLPPKKNSKKI